MLKVALGHAEEIDTRTGVGMAIEQARCTGQATKASKSAMVSSSAAS